jgi:glucokinase
MALYYAVDIGGTKVEVGLGDENGQLLATKRISTPLLGRGEAIMDGVVDLLKQLPGGQNAVAVGIASPGPLDAKGGRILRPSNLPGWEGLPIGEGLSRRLGMPAYVDNDATAAGMGEWRWGAGRGTRNMIYVTVSTGVGSGIIAEGRVLRGRGDNAGELGHIVVDPEGERCHCGLTGCLETICSGASIARHAEARRHESPRLSAVDGPVTAADVFAAYRAGDAVATQIVGDVTYWLAWAFGSLVNLFNTERFVVGGGVAAAGDLLLDPIRRQMSQFAWPELLEGVDVVPAAFGPDTGVRGALAVALDRHRGG